MEENEVKAYRLYQMARIYCHGSDRYTTTKVKEVFGEMANVVKQNHAMAFNLFSESASLGNTESLCCIGCCYKRGYGCKCNMEYAIKWYMRAIENGSSRAKGHLLSWAKDFYKDRNYLKAVKIFNLSKAFLDDESNFMLGFCYEEGKGGLCLNKEKAKEQYDEIKGNLLDFADFLYTGRYVGHPRLSNAFEWYKKSAAQGNIKALFSVGYCFEKGLGTMTDIDLAQIFYNQITKADDQFSIGLDFLCGFRNYHKWQKKYPEGKMWIEKAASQGHVKAILLLGICYMKGYGVETCQMKADSLFNKIINPNDQYDVGCFLSTYEYAHILEIDDDFSLSWIIKAAKQGHAEAQFKVAMFKLELDSIGYIVSDENHANYTEGIQWLDKSASQGHAEAQFYLGKCYAEGFGISTDKEEAIMWLERAAKQNNIEAQQYLANLLNK